jgi:hypothetical protein
MNVSIKAISSKTGLSWSAVFMFALLLAFILYTASIGSLVKYKAFLFGPINSSSSSGTTMTSATGQGVDAQTEASIQQSVKQAASSGGILGDLQTVGETAGLVAAFV